jgi:uncharacterized protein YfbU (UPF0304 family)
MVFVTTITYVSPDETNTIEITESPSLYMASKWKHKTISSWYSVIVGTDPDNNYELPKSLNDIMNNIDEDSEEECNYKVDIIKFVIEMQNKYEKKYGKKKIKKKIKKISLFLK